VDTETPLKQEEKKKRGQIRILWHFFRKSSNISMIRRRIAGIIDGFRRESRHI
jgi:hypothetical protein